MNGNDDYSMNIGNNLAVNTAVIQMEATVDELIDSTGKTLKEAKKELKTRCWSIFISSLWRKKIRDWRQNRRGCKTITKEANRYHL